MTSKLSRRAVALGLFALPVSAFAQASKTAPKTSARRALIALTPAEQAKVDKATAYLQGLTRARGRFTQTDPRNKTATGDLYLQRPGKMRLAYDPPNDILVVADGNRISIQDRRLRTFEQYPLMGNPLSLFLAREIRLDRGVRVTKVTPTPRGYAITALDAGKPNAGQITLVFDESPMQLKEWTVLDAQGGATRLVLTDLAPVASLDPALFVLKDTRVRPGGARP